MKNYKLAVVGATGLVGRTFLTVLEEKNLPIDEYIFLASKNSAGKIIKFNGKEYKINELNESSFDDNIDFAFFCAGGDISRKYAPIAQSKGTIVIDNSSAFRMDPNVPLVVPEVNPDDLLTPNKINANPHCSTIQAVVPLKILDDLYSIKRIVYFTYQAVSGAGKQGVDDLLLEENHKSPKKFPHTINNNCLPHIDSFEDNGYTKEEMKMINETRKILHKPDLKITATCVRVPVINSHSEGINVELYNKFDLTQIKDTFSSSKGLTLLDDPSHNIYPLATLASGQDNILVGRIRKDESVDNGINFWCAADNLRKGAASNGVQILELLLTDKYNRKN